MSREFDVAVVGAGILGLAHAWAAARAGARVVLFERSPRAQGASIRNFGMVWPIGQWPRERYEIALRSRQRWLELSQSAGIWVEPCGSLHLAYADDELAVLEEFVAGKTHDCQLLSPAEAVSRYPAVEPNGLRAALYSATECCVDPRQAIAQLPAFLAERFGVQLHFGTTITRIEAPHLTAADGRRWQARHILVCSGSDFETLFPEVLATAGLRRCKLQMLRTAPQPDGWRIGSHIAGGLTLCHYAAFSTCPSLPVLRQRFQQTMPRYLHFGIHVMASQNHLGEIVIGDSHEYDDDIDIFDKQEIDDLILAYLRRMLRLPNWDIAARWHGIYAKHPEAALFTAQPQSGVTVRVAPGGAGMTLAFGLADVWWEQSGIEP